MMSRSFGDQVAHSCGVTHVPGKLALPLKPNFKDVKIFKIKKNFEAIVLGSDGIWEKLKNIEAANIIAPYSLKKEASKAADNLVLSSMKRWRTVSRHNL